MKNISKIFIALSIILVSACSQQNPAPPTTTPAPKTSVITIAGLDFTLPKDWSVKEQTNDTSLLLSVPDAKYDVAIPMTIRSTNYEVDEELFTKETASGAKIYTDFCAPVIACYLVAYKQNVYEIIFEVPKSNEPLVGENPEGPVFPSTQITDKDTLEFVTTIK